ncbi:dTDP-4-dehydrorhamnose 3,5-epimerase [Clostridium sp. YIM B02555]|uniref:dTDP-4-dehydrorhamnose 3,5-epimerase n=1 Tax=Clostridium sp. YIM B02555 TaxID=2911968 RepID=UPI001EED6DD1|nr:dTDP-4-dehydrorhamnose 3,5-epimerase [Clostridium sp. YIM B02555]
MHKFFFEETTIKDLFVVTPFYNEDDRGIFVKSFEKDIFKENGIDFVPYEYFETTSKRYVIRGLHFQTENPQAKLIRVPYGRIFDVAVDIRSGSKTFGKWYGITLSSENRKMFYIPKGFAHGFLTLSDIAIVSYLCDDKYSAETDDGIFWGDKDLAIDWPISNEEEITISDRDEKLQAFKKFSRGI